MGTLSELDEFELEIFRIYKAALLYIGVDFDREDVQDAIVYCAFNLEDACRSTIEYFHSGKMQYPNAFLIKALTQGWKPWHWRDEWLEDPNFKSPCLLWWEEAAFALGVNKRNALIADVTEDERGQEYVLLTNGETLSLARAKSLGWERLIEYAES